jgi:hypothetical protein
MAYAAGFRGPPKGPAEGQAANPLTLRVLPGRKPIRAGEARNIASVRAYFLGTHPGSRSPADARKVQ